VAVLQGNAKQGSTRGFYPKNINGSLRFNDDDGAYLSWTPESAGNRKTWTFSCWVKRGNLKNNSRFFGNLADNDSLYFNEGDLNFYSYNGGYNYRLVTNAVYRDPSAWYHIVIAIDTTQATSSDRLSMYVNGEKITSFATAIYPSQNYDGYINNTQEHRLGTTYTNLHFDGYLAEVHFTDGTAYDADAFGEFKNGVWVAKTPDVTYGTNGFYLDFQDDTEVEAFNTVLWRGNGATQSITGMGFQPDLLWVKVRNEVNSNYLFDSVRGADQAVFTDLTLAEVDYSATGRMTSFDSDGFTVKYSSSTGTNASGDSYVAWGWKAGDSNVSNTDGSITSTVRANDTYGFSIIEYTGNGASGGATLGHGLNDVPAFGLFKTTSKSNNWMVYHKDVGNERFLYLDQTNGQTGTSAQYWDNTTPDSDVWYFQDYHRNNESGTDYIAYCWAEKSGYSKFGSYDGATGTTTVTTNFAPAMVIIKNTTDTGGKEWMIFDNTRDVTDPITKYVQPNNSNTEADSGSSNSITFNSDGFTLNGDGGLTNKSGGTYIYAAFADTREAAFWLDQSGNDNDWQPVNLDHNDTVSDSPTDNFATLNPLDKSSAATLSDGNLRISQGASQGTTFSTIGINSGKYYFECTLTSSYYEVIGIVPESQSTSLAHPGSGSNSGFGYLPISGTYYENGSQDTGHTTAGTGDVVMFAIDLDSSSIWVGVNGVWNEGDPSAGTGSPYTGLTSGETYLVGIRPYDSTVEFNFGQQPFKYDPPA
jgi:hypothetical protein